MITILLYIALFFYCTVDAYHTYQLLELGAYEMNPLIRWMFEVSGTWVVVLGFKVILLVVLGILLIVKQREDNHGRT